MNSPFMPLQVSPCTESHVMLPATFILTTVLFAMAAFVLTVALVSNGGLGRKMSS
jgi:hypothetical protein